MNANKEKLFKNWKIVKGDQVVGLRGKDKGKSGLVTKIYRSQNRLIVEGFNQVEI